MWRFNRFFAVVRGKQGFLLFEVIFVTRKMGRSCAPEARQGVFIRVLTKRAQGFKIPRK